MIRSCILFAAAVAASLSSSPALAFPACSSLPSPAPDKICRVGMHEACVSSERCTMANTPVVARRCYKWTCSGGPANNQPFTPVNP